MPTIFTRIIQGEIPSYVIRESDQFYAFLDIRPISPGHTLVVPKIEVDELFDLDAEFLQQMLPFTRPIAHALRKVTGLRVGMLVAGFEVPHAHMHLIPIRSERDLDFGRAKPANDAELQVMQQLIAAEL